MGRAPSARGLRAGRTRDPAAHALRPRPPADARRRRGAGSGAADSRGPGLLAAALLGRSLRGRAAAREAVAEAGLAPPLRRRERRVSTSRSSTGGLYESEEYLAQRWQGRQPRLSLFASQQLNGPGDAVARRLGVTGPVDHDLLGVRLRRARARGGAARPARTARWRSPWRAERTRSARSPTPASTRCAPSTSAPAGPSAATAAGCRSAKARGVLVLETDAHAAARGGRAARRAARARAPPATPTT